MSFYLKDIQTKDKDKLSTSRGWLLVLMFFAGVVMVFVWWGFQQTFQALEETSRTAYIPPIQDLKLEKEKEAQKQKSLAEPVYTYTPVENISMKNIKANGCVTDGLLSGYGGDTDAEVAMINRSRCLYLHRALETWNAPPDFDKASRIMEQINSKKIVYGMFIAEAIKKNAIYYYPDEKRFFNFRKMCRNDSDNAWGENTCKPSFNSKEYRKYLNYITQKAMDLGIQSFLFGQVYYQDASDLSKSKLPNIVSDIKDYARKKNIDIIIGGQTGTITDKKYLHNFDYIEGGVGIGEDGQIESGPCWSRMESCWALLWNKKYAQNAKHIFLHLDWSGLSFDDMSVFARMSAVKRAQVLKQLHKYFVSRDMGFMMPMMATLDSQNGGCFGPSADFYSASRIYGCKDEDVINLILKEQ